METLSRKNKSAYRRRRRALTVAVLSVALGATGCSSGWDALGTRTATVLLNGQEVAQPKVQCDQVQWVWHIRSLQEQPGFSAQVHTGDTVEPRAVQIEGLGGFTGSYWDLTVGSAEASVENRTFTVTGTAEGYYASDPAERSTADFEIHTDC